MGMKNKPLTIFDTITRLKGVFERNPNKTLIGGSECGDIAERCGLQPVPVEEKMAVPFYWVKDVKAAIAKLEAQARQEEAVRQQLRSDEPTPLIPGQAPNRPVSLTDAGEFLNPIKVPEPKDEPARNPTPTAQTVIEPTPNAAVTDDASAADDETSDDAVAKDGQADGAVQAPVTSNTSFESMGLNSQAIAALRNNGVETPTALRNLFDSSGIAGLKGLEGVGEKLAKQISAAMTTTAAA